MILKSLNLNIVVWLTFLLSQSTVRFGIELSPDVVRADGNVRNLAWRICMAKVVLVRAKRSSDNETS